MGFYYSTPDDIARVIATNYLAEFGVSGVRFGRFKTDESTVTLGLFGYADSE